MDMTYSWSVNHIFSYPNFAGQENVVCKVQWRYKGENESGVSSSRGGVTEINFQPDKPFIPFGELTEEQVLGWVRPTISQQDIEKMGLEIQEDIAVMIDLKKQKREALMELPWSNSSPILSQV